jgi:hypothetical protein
MTGFALALLTLHLAAEALGVWAALVVAPPRPASAVLLGCPPACANYEANPVACRRQAGMSRKLARKSSGAAFWTLRPRLGFAPSLISAGPALSLGARELVAAASRAAPGLFATALFQHHMKRMRELHIFHDHVIFTGPHAEQRARRFYERLQPTTN